jgi:hypothetical protein
MAGNLLVQIKIYQNPKTGCGPEILLAFQLFG